MKILFLSTDDVYFCRSRVGLAREAKERGFDVILMSPISNCRAEIEKEGIRVIPWNLSRKTLNPFLELKSLLEVVKVYRREQPDIVQHEALKAIVHGSVAMRFVGPTPSVSVICGLGSIFTRPGLKMKVIRSLLLRILTTVFNSPNAQVAFHNQFDRDHFVKMGVVNGQRALVSPGNGVSVEKFTPQPEPDGTPIVALPSRMLWEKGVGEFVEAAGALKERGVSARFALVGAPDPHNLGCISEEQLRAWDNSGVVEWWGHRNDMLAAYAQSTLICLPSYYGEGLPNVLTEAGACRRAVVTTDVPGCRQAVSHELNGLLVAPRNSGALALAIERLLKDPELRLRLASKGRERAVNEFSHAKIVAEILEIYQNALGKKWPSSTRAISRDDMQRRDLAPS